MDRLLLDHLINWKALPERKPLLIDGARQTGKTWLVKRLFGPANFRRIHAFDFRLQPKLQQLFRDALDPVVLLKNLSLFIGEDIDPTHDLIFFDEIGECQRAVDSLKYFSELRPDLYVCASGSNVGLLESFPVGKVQQITLYPLRFEEFLMASGEEDLVEAFREQSRLMAAHDRLWRHLLDYYYVGGMPEAVNTWFQWREQGINARIEAVRAIHRRLFARFWQVFWESECDAHRSRVPQYSIAIGSCGRWQRSALSF